MATSVNTTGPSETGNTTELTLQDVAVFTPLSMENKTLCLPPNTSMTLSSEMEVAELEHECMPPPLPSEFYPLRVTANCVLGLVCIVSFVLCFLFLRALKKTKVSSRWCMASVIAMDIALGVMQMYGVVVFLVRYAFNLHSPMLECTSTACQILMKYWTGLPSLLSLLTLALDQFLAIAFPLGTHLKSYDRVKKISYSLVIWAPSTLFCVVFAVKWLALEERTCFAFLMILAHAAAPFGTAGIICLGLNLVVYGALFVKVVIFKYCNSLRKSTHEDDQGKQRSLVFVFSAIFVANSIFWLPPWMFLVFAELCAIDDMACNDRFRDIYLILMIFYQLNTIFDPLFLAWRFPIIGRQLQCTCRERKEQSVKAKDVIFQKERKMKANSSETEFPSAHTNTSKNGTDDLRT